jgi:hypothetical protein
MFIYGIINILKKSIFISRVVFWRCCKKDIYQKHFNYLIYKKNMWKIKKNIFYKSVKNRENISDNFLLFLQRGLF